MGRTVKGIENVFIFKNNIYTKSTWNKLNLKELKCEKLTLKKFEYLNYCFLGINYQLYLLTEMSFVGAVIYKF